MRGISLTYGQTTIDGGFVRTGEISSIDGVTKFNLNTGTISGRITFAAGSSGYANISDKPVLGSLSGLNIVELAQLGTTVITGGYLATSLIDANYIRTIDLIANKVTTGKLQSVNTLNYFDLTNNQFKVGNATNYMDWNVTTPNVLTIKGHITADSGTISGVTINANDQFSLNGSKVEIFPNAGMRVFGAGYADFTNATLKVPTVTPSGLASGEAALWIGSLSGVASGASGGSVATLSDVALTSLATGQILVWNGATWVNQNNVAAVDLSAYYTKTETQNFFSGASAMSGYNKANWDSAYAASHSHANKAFLDGITSGSTVGINISGDAARTPLLVGLGSYVWYASTPATSYSLGITNSFVSHVEGFPGYGSLMNMKTYDGGSAGGTLQLFAPYGDSFPSISLRYRISNYNTGAWTSWKVLVNTEDLGSAAYTSSSAYYSAGSTVANSTLWGGMSYVGADTTVNTYMFGYGSDGAWHPIGQANLRSFLGLGSNAYTSTSYLPISGGSITGDLYISGQLSFAGGANALDVSGYTIFRDKLSNNRIWFGHTGDPRTLYDLPNNTTSHVFRRLDGAAIASFNGTDLTTILGGGLSGTTASFSGTITSSAGVYDTGSRVLSQRGNTYYQVDTWLQLNGNFGMVAGTNGAHIYPNYISSYTNWAISGSRGSYGGFYDAFSGVNFAMYDNGGNGGIYREATGRWYIYHSVANNCLGIGSSATTSGYAAQVNGNLRVEGTAYATGDVIGFTTSDRRLKDNLRPIENSLEKLSKLSGNYFEWNALQDTYEVGSTDIGVIAQEVEAVFPEMVTTRANGFKAVRYEKLSAVLLMAVKELSAEIKQLKAERRVS